MHQEQNESAYFKIDQNGIMNIVGNFDPETLADIFFIMKQPEFKDSFIKSFSNKLDEDFIDKFKKRVESQDTVVKTVEESFIHPLQSWKNTNEN